MKRQNVTTDLTQVKKTKPEIGPGGCSFWNVKKDRFCKMVAKNNSLFCGQHLPSDGLRTSCPHCQCSIQTNRLEKHLKKCNILKEQSIIPKYFEKGNLGTFQRPFQ